MNHKKRTRSWAFIVWSVWASTLFAFTQDLPRPTYTQEGQALVQGVQNLAENKKARGDDFKNVIQETISFGRSPNAADRFYSSLREDPQGLAQAEWQKFIDDSFSILNEGEKRYPQDPEWPKLREELSKLRPPQGADSKPKPDKKNQQKNQGKDQKKDKKQKKGSGKDKQQQSGGGQKSEEQDQSGGEGAEGEGESEGPPSQGQPGKGDKKGGKKGGESDEGGEGENQGQEKASRGKDPNQVKEFNTSKEGEGQMKERGRNEEMKGMEDEKAGFGSLGQDKKEGQEQAGGAGGQGGEESAEAPPGMRVVGGGSGKKASDKSSDPMTLEAMSRLEQVKQSDSPAILQQRLQPQDQRPQPSSLGKPW